MRIPASGEGGPLATNRHPSLGGADGGWDDAMLLLLADLSRGEYSAAHLDVKVESQRKREWHRKVDRLRRHLRHTARRAGRLGLLSKVSGTALGLMGSLYSLVCPSLGKAVKIAGAVASGGLDIARAVERSQERQLNGRRLLAEDGMEIQDERFSDVLSDLDQVVQTERSLNERIADLCSSEQKLRTTAGAGGRG